MRERPLCIGLTISYLLSPRQESNLHYILRKDASYPLNDEGVDGNVPHSYLFHISRTHTRCVRGLRTREWQNGRIPGGENSAHTRTDCCCSSSCSCGKGSGFVGRRSSYLGVSNGSSGSCRGATSTSSCINRH